MSNTPVMETETTEKDFNDAYKKEVLKDFWDCCVSREVSLLGRKEVLTGKAKFGIFGDGKEVPQVAMSRVFKEGDWRSGYYRDQTFVMSSGIGTPENCFAQLYADTENEPWCGGRQMTGHFSTPTIDKNGNWTNHNETKNISCDISCTAGQMARGVGLALASKKYREIPELNETQFSRNGDEVVFVTIGDASTSEGVFWESINAAGVMKIPMVVSVWDDGYGISVPKEYQTTKASISEVLEGFRLDETGNGIAIFTAKAWDYIGLCQIYEEAVDLARTEHTPVLIHVEECTQQIGHSTSGSHERYKSAERLEWEKEMDCNRVMREWMIESGLATQEEVDGIILEAKSYVKEARDTAWSKASSPVKEDKAILEDLLQKIDAVFPSEEVEEVKKEFKMTRKPEFNEVIKMARRLRFAVIGKQHESIDELDAYLTKTKNIGFQRFHTNLYSSSPYSALNVPVVPPEFTDDSPMKNGYQILNELFDHALANNPAVCAFGEDVGYIGDVNQGFAGLQEKYGEARVFDCGIREWTIMGQAIGMAMRGLRPIAEIQYLDYLLYGLEPLSDDLATLRWRSAGQQQAPAIIRTRGHRLEGVWHSGSPMSMMINSLRGMYLLTPRNMLQAAGMYNTMLQSDDPAVIVECLNGYRLKERMPNNIGTFTVPLGVPEILQEGTDVTLVTYGSCVKIAESGIELLKKHGISVELIDVQTLLPFDLESMIVESLKKTNRIVFLDEDVPGGATSYMMQEVLEKQNGYRYLDSKPLTITASEHRTPYGSDGDYFSKPNAEDVFEVIHNIIQESDPQRFV
ncbi:MAG: pyruvate/2-oxoglutarate/acetoin dehydrogenase E1 component/TPP-dependent pyruvate [Saprospiraceae bacterium]|jgi:pyruvate/2-oxoglutarate/acetoin dehydrogenase E1 component/TPP-dependent pyruvate/acetoin dehydrogenase alpha subunit